LSVGSQLPPRTVNISNQNRKLACGGPGGYGCNEDAHCSFEDFLARLGVLAKSSHRQHEDADLQDKSKDTEFVEVLQAQA